jgi:hypothetical protein
MSRFSREKASQSVRGDSNYLHVGDVDGVNNLPGRLVAIARDVAYESTNISFLQNFTVVFMEKYPDRRSGSRSCRRC